MYEFILVRSHRIDALHVSTKQLLLGQWLERQKRELMEIQTIVSEIHVAYVHCTLVHKPGQEAIVRCCIVLYNFVELCRVFVKCFKVVFCR